MRNKLILTIFLSIFLIGMVAAVNDCGNDNTFLGKFQSQHTITLKQICDSCNFVNLSSVAFPNGTTKLYGESMTKDGINYNYSFSETNQIGCYSYTVLGDKGTSNQSETIDFIIGQMPITFYAAWFILTFGLAILGFKLENEYVLALAGMGVGGLGVYVFTNGIDIYKNGSTEMVAYFIVAIGIIFVGMAIERMYENLN